MSDINIVKHKSVADEFGRSSINYHQEAEIQQKVSEGLVASLRPWKQILPDGPILEIGCGTGFLSQRLISEFPTREINITDASEEMVSFANSHLEYSDSNRVNFDVFNPEIDILEEESYSLIISNFAAQWFEDTAYTMAKLSKALKKDGLILFSFPGNKSFPEWYQACLETGLPFSANPLPDTEEVVIKLSMEDVQVDYYENSLHQKFESSYDFFRHIKNIGASVSKTGKQLSAKAFRILNEHWNDKVKGDVNIEWHIVYIAAKKN